MISQPKRIPNYTWSLARTYGYDIIHVYTIIDTLCTQVAKVCSFRVENVRPKTLDDNPHKSPWSQYKSRHGMLHWAWHIGNHCGYVPDSKVYGANMGPTWGRQDPGGPHVGPMNLAIWGVILSMRFKRMVLSVTWHLCPMHSFYHKHGEYDVIITLHCACDNLHVLVWFIHLECCKGVHDKDISLVKI